MTSLSLLALGEPVKANALEGYQPPRASKPPRDNEKIFLGMPKGGARSIICQGLGKEHRRRLLTSNAAQHSCPLAYILVWRVPYFEDLCKKVVVLPLKQLVRSSALTETKNQLEGADGSCRQRNPGALDVPTRKYISCRCRAEDHNGEVCVAVVRFQVSAPRGMIKRVAKGVKPDTAYVIDHFFGRPGLFGGGGGSRGPKWRSSTSGLGTGRGTSRAGCGGEGVAFLSSDIVISSRGSPLCGLYFFLSVGRVEVRGFGGSLGPKLLNVPRGLRWLGRLELAGDLPGAPGGLRTPSFAISVSSTDQGEHHAQARQLDSSQLILAQIQKVQPHPGLELRRGGSVTMNSAAHRPTTARIAEELQSVTRVVLLFDRLVAIDYGAILG